MAHKLGTPVQQIVQPIKGRVVRTQYNESEERVEHLVESYDGTQGFWLAADALEVDPVQQAADEAAVAEAQALAAATETQTVTSADVGDVAAVLGKEGDQQ